VVRATSAKYDLHAGKLTLNKSDVVLTVHRRYYVEIKCQLDATDEFFIADLIACSTAAARKLDTQPSTPPCTDNLKTKHQIRQITTTCIIL
jgi:hypothetical protein